MVGTAQAASLLKSAVDCRATGDAEAPISGMIARRKNDNAVATWNESIQAGPRVTMSRLLPFCLALCAIGAIMGGESIIFEDVATTIVLSGDAPAITARPDVYRSFVIPMAGNSAVIDRNEAKKISPLLYSRVTDNGRILLCARGDNPTKDLTRDKTHCDIAVKQCIDEHVRLGTQFTLTKVTERTITSTMLKSHQNPSLAAPVTIIGYTYFYDTSLDGIPLFNGNINFIYAEDGITTVSYVPLFVEKIPTEKARAAEPLSLLRRVAANPVYNKYFFKKTVISSEVLGYFIKTESPDAASIRIIPTWKYCLKPLAADANAVSLLYLDAHSGEPVFIDGRS